MRGRGGGGYTSPFLLTITGEEDTLKRREARGTAPLSKKRMYDCIYHYETSSTTPQLASSTCALSTSTPSIATTSDIVTVPSMTAGEILIAFLLLALILVQMTGYLVAALDRIRTKKQVLGYGGGDVELRDDI